MESTKKETEEKVESLTAEKQQKTEEHQQKMEEDQIMKRR